MIREGHKLPGDVTGRIPVLIEQIEKDAILQGSSERFLQLAIESYRKE